MIEVDLRIIFLLLPNGWTASALAMKRGSYDLM